MAAAQAAPKQVKISDVRRLLKEGYTRWTNEETEPGKSIQTHYALRFSECKDLFNHPKVKGLKTRVVTLQIIDDTDGGEVITNVSDSDEDETTVVATPESVEAIMTAATPVAVTPATPVIEEAPEVLFD